MRDEARDEEKQNKVEKTIASKMRGSQRQCLKNVWNRYWVRLTRILDRTIINVHSLGSTLLKTEQLKEDKENDSTISNLNQTEGNLTSLERNWNIGVISLIIFFITFGVFITRRSC